MARAYVYDMVDTWNAGATTFTAIKMNVTDTASAAGSLLMDLQVGGSSKFSVSKLGVVTASTNILAFGLIRSYSAFQLDADTILTRDAANILAQRNGTAAQTFRVYNTYTDASNYERAGAVWFGNIFYLGTQAAGTGTGSREIIFFTNGTNRWSIGGSSGNLLAATDNTYDIGASGANRPRALYLGGSATLGQGIQIGSTAGYNWASGTNIKQQSDGVITLFNNGDTSFGRLQFGGTTNAFPALKRNGASLDVVLANDSGYTILNASQVNTTGTVIAFASTGAPAGGTTGTGIRMSSTANFGVFFGSGAPTLSAAKGSLYLRSDGTTTNDRMYVNTDGATTWTAVTTAA